ncbi:MAG: hypothetical protein KF760_11110 [Candidatus Eremiobacteraeota bacterium]|nr:hypothetical protein [Candidatus Eremiobacteraeota bacterium]
MERTSRGKKEVNYRQGWPLLIILGALIFLHSPGLLDAKVYGDEDVLAVFFVDKYRLHRLWLGQEAWSFWDPQPFLGMPRLANVQMAWFAPDCLFFGILHPLTAWRIYPFIGDLCLLSAAFFLLRARLSVPAAWMGAGFYALTGDCLKVAQDEHTKSAVIAFLLLLGAQQHWLNSGRRRFLVVLALAAYWHLSTGSASQLYYQFLTLPLFCLLQFREADKASRWSRAALAGLTLVGASLVGLFPWFPLTEWSAHGSRALMGGSNFAEAYRLNGSELVRVFVSELTAFGPQSLIENGGGYALNAGFSAALLVLVAYACVRDRRCWPAVALAVLVSLQMLGDRGVLLWMLHKLVPYTQQIRGPHRFFFTGGLLWVQVAALGFDQMLLKRRWLAWSLGFWALAVNLWIMAPQIRGAYLEAAAFAGPPLPPNGGQRMAVNFAPNPKPPLQWLPHPLTEGRRTLIIPNVICEANYFRGLLYSQYGERAQELLAGFVYSFTPIPPRRPQQPLLRSWGLSWVLQPQGDQFGWQFLGSSPRYWTVVQVDSALNEESENLWAARSDWKPFEQACLRGNAPALGKTPARILSVHEQADLQIIETDGDASLLLCSDNWDPGWECLIDGKPAEVLRANVALKACLLPPGRHEVRWRYRLLWLPKAVASAALGILLLGSVGLLARKAGAGATESSPSKLV